MYREKKKRGIEEATKVSHLSDGKNAVPHTEMRKNVGAAGREQVLFALG